MLTVLRRELFGWLRRPASVVWAVLLHVGLLLLVVSFWPGEHQPADPTWLARLVIYDFFEKILLLVLLVTPVATASSFAAEHERATLHLLRLTRLTPFQIVLGKLFSGVGYMLLLLLSTLPYLTILLGLGGVSFKAVLTLYAFLATTILYVGLLGQVVALRVRGRVRAVLATLALVFSINMVLPSIQLSLQYYELVRSNIIRLDQLTPPSPEDLFSTPQRDVLHFYVIDLLSPYSVYLNFRHVQLGEVSAAPFASYERHPASDFGMIHHHWTLLALLLPLVALVAARRLERLQPRPVADAANARADLWGRVPRNAAITACLAGLFGAYAFAVFLNAIVERGEPPRLLTILAMIACGLVAGTGAADTIARDRDRGTLPVHALTGTTARRYIARCLRPTVGLLAIALAGYSAGLLLPRLPELRPEGIAPLPGDMIAMSLLCIVALCAISAAAGLFFSSVCRTTLGARVGVILLVFFLLVHWRLAAPFDMSAFAVIDASDYGAAMKAIFRAIAWTKLVVATATHFLNPFAIVTHAFEAPGGGDAADTASFAPDATALLLLATPLLLASFVVLLGVLTHRRLVRRFFFTP